MLPESFKQVKEKLLNIDRLHNQQFPLEVVDIINSYSFLQVNTQPFYEVIKKHKENLNQIFSGNCYNLYKISEFRSHWSFVAPWLQTRDFTEIYYGIQGIVCNKCGEFDRSSLFVRLHQQSRGGSSGGYFTHLPKCKCERMYEFVINIL